MKFTIPRGCIARITPARPSTVVVDSVVQNGEEQLLSPGVPLEVWPGGALAATGADGLADADATVTLRCVRVPSVRVLVMFEFDVKRSN